MTTPTPPPYPPPYPNWQHQPPPRKPRRWPWLVGTGGALLLVVSVGAAMSDPAPTGSAQPATTRASSAPAAPTYSPPPRPVAPPAPPTPVGPASTAGEGIYIVGEDIKPGRWKTPGPDQTDIIPSCYFEISDGSGAISGIRQNDNIGGPGVLQVSDGEWLKLSGSCVWSLS